MPTFRQRISAFRNPPTEAKAFSNAPYIEASVPVGDTVATGRRPSDVTHLARMFTQWPWKCSVINAQGVASIPIRVYRERTNDEYTSKRVDRKHLDHVRAGCVGPTVKALDTSDKMDEVTDPDHPLVALLNRPNPWMSGFEFLEALGVSLQLAGTTFSNIVQPEDSPPTGMNFMPTPWTKIVADREQYVSHYVYGVDGSTERTFDATEVIRIKMPNPTGVDMQWGVGPMHAAYLAQEVSNNVLVFQSSLFHNGGFPSLIAVMKRSTEDQLKALKVKLDNIMRGSRKAGTIATLSGEVELTKWSMSQEELGFLQAAKDKRDEIAAIFGVPTSLLTVEDVNLANGKIAAPQWQLLTIRPLTQRIEDALNTDLLPRFRAYLDDPSLCVAFDNPVEEEQGVRGERATALYQGGIVTLNEAREEAGWDSVPDGDSFFDPIGTGLDFPMIGERDPIRVPNLASERPAALPQAGDKLPNDVPTGTEGEPKVQETGLNGAQVTALQELLQSISDGLQSAGVVRELILSAFPLMDPARVETMVSEAESFGRNRPNKPQEGTDEVDDRDPVAVPRGDRTDGDGGGASGTSGDAGRKSGHDSGEAGPTSERLALFLGTDHDQVGEQVWMAKRLSDGSIEWKDDDDDDLRAVRRAVARSEAEMDRVLQRYFDRLMPEITESLKRDGTIGLDLSPDGDAGIILRDMLSESASEAFMFGVDTGLRELGERVTDDVVQTATDRARQAAQANLIRLSESTLSTVKEGAEHIAQDVLARTAGEDFREVQRQLGEELQGRSTGITRRIARTESNRMHSDGRLASWKESGVVTRKRWITRGDNRVAEPCLTIARQYNTAALDEPFVKAGQTIAGFTFNYDPRGLMAPPAKPNCRCTMIAGDD